MKNRYITKKFLLSKIHILIALSTILALATIILTVLLCTRSSKQSVMNTIENTDLIIQLNDNDKKNFDLKKLNSLFYEIRKSNLNSIQYENLCSSMRDICNKIDSFGKIVKYQQKGLLSYLETNIDDETKRDVHDRFMVFGHSDFIAKIIVVFDQIIEYIEDSKLTQTQLDNVLIVLHNELIVYLLVNILIPNSTETANADDDSENNEYESEITDIISFFYQNLLILFKKADMNLIDQNGDIEKTVYTLQNLNSFKHILFLFSFNTLMGMVDDVSDDNVKLHEYFKAEDLMLGFGFKEKDTFKEIWGLVEGNYTQSMSKFLFNYPTYNLTEITKSIRKHFLFLKVILGEYNPSLDK